MTMAKKSARRRSGVKVSARRPARSRRVAKRAATKPRAKRATRRMAKRATARTVKQARARTAKRQTSKTRSTRSKKAKPRVSKPSREALLDLSGKKPRLDRARRILDDLVPTPPSSLDLDRRSSAARTGRAELQDSIQEHTGMTPALTGGDVDADWENAYFSGDEAPGGDNPTPDQEVVDDIGRALGVEYQDSEELRGSDKVVERDKHRWELDPASSEDFRDRK